ncbi:hypothetical protein WN944_000706 [Citrus x changshan-huyou]|uniref:Uncharacterized protein n=1 Tax=Citrus x changshan-huyou TaxID=2935761 RepID=A0AAP0MHU9_9ROSI
MSGRPGCALGSSDMGKWVCMVIVMLMCQYLPLVIYAMWISHEKPNFLGFAYTPEYMGIQLNSSDVASFAFVAAVLVAEARTHKSPAWYTITIPKPPHFSA